MEKPDIKDVFYQNYSDIHRKFHFNYMAKENNWHTDDTNIIAGFNNEMDAKRFCMIEQMIDVLMSVRSQIKWDRLTFEQELGEKPISCDNAIDAIEELLKKAGREF